MSRAALRGFAAGPSLATEEEKEATAPDHDSRENHQPNRSPPMEARGNGSTPSSQSSNGGADGRALWREKRYELVKRYRLHRADCVPSLQGPSH